MRLTTLLRRPGRVVSAALATALIATACSGSGATEAAGTVRPAKMTVVVPGITELFNLPLVLADQLGFLDDEGLDVKLIEIKSGTAAIGAVLAGDADAANGFQGHTVNMAAKGQSVRSFVTTMNSLGMALVVRPGAGRPIDDIADLKGAVVGVSAPGAGSHMLLNYLLHQHGMPLDDVSVAGIGIGATALAAVEHGQVDAAITVDPTVSKLRQRVDGLKLLVDIRTEKGLAEVFGPGGYPSMAVYSRSTWLDENRDTAAKFAAAVTRALRWIHDHDADEIAAAVPSELAGDNPSLYVSTIATAKSTFSTDGRLSPEAAGAAHRMLALSVPEVAAADINLADTYTNEFLPTE